MNTAWLVLAVLYVVKNVVDGWREETFFGFAICIAGAIAWACIGCVCAMRLLNG